MKKSQTPKNGRESYDSTSPNALYRYKNTNFSIAFLQCFLFWQEHLFEGKLRTTPMLDLTPAAHTKGFYKPAGWKEGKETVAGIWLSYHLLFEPVQEIMKTFVRLIGLHYQHQFGKPGSKGYHNLDYSKKNGRDRVTNQHFCGPFQKKNRS